jgi:pimeloyl-ACP methyl ester carboxylesterase
MRDVIVLHGLWVSGLVMAPLAARLATEGFRCHLFRYAGRGHPPEANADRLLRFRLALGPAHFVGHSLGGLVILDALGKAPGVAAGKVVLLGVPATGSFSGRRFATHRFGRWLMGRSQALWRERGTARWNRPEPLGVIAGTLPLGLGHALGRLPGPNDGVVCVEETAVEGMRDRILLPVSHSAMILSARVAAQTAEFLRHGKFRRDEA